MSNYVTPNKYVNLVNEMHGAKTLTRQAMYYRIEQGLMDVKIQSMPDGKKRYFIDLAKYPVAEYQRFSPGVKKE